MANVQVALPIPKCLDNVLRLRIQPPHAGSSSAAGEVDIVTEPKILPLPHGTFVTRGKTLHARAGAYKLEDGWEDGETTGPEDFTTDSESGDEGVGWLEGRFQGCVRAGNEVRLRG